MCSISAQAGLICSSVCFYMFATMRAHEPFLFVYTHCARPANSLSMHIYAKTQRTVRSSASSARTMRATVYNERLYCSVTMCLHTMKLSAILPTDKYGTANNADCTTGVFLDYNAFSSDLSFCLLLLRSPGLRKHSHTRLFASTYLFAQQCET